MGIKKVKFLWPVVVMACIFSYTFYEYYERWMLNCSLNIFFIQ